MVGPRGEIADVGTVFLPYPLGVRYRMFIPDLGARIKVLVRPLLTRLRLPVRAAAHSRRLKRRFRVPIMATALRLGSERSS